MKEHNIDKVDIIWMDLQGAELLALKSLGEKLQDVKYIHTEISHTPIYTNQALFPEIHEYLVNNNFKLSSTIQSNFGDAVYKNKLLEKTVV